MMKVSTAMLFKKLFGLMWGLILFPALLTKSRDFNSVQSVAVNKVVTELSRNPLALVVFFLLGRPFIKPDSFLIVTLLEVIE
jgi:hypothetical protein